MPPPPHADGVTNPEQHLRTQHSRREAGSQSHGTPPESAGPPRDVTRARCPAGDRSKEELLAFGGGRSHVSSQLTRRTDRRRTRSGVRFRGGTDGGAGRHRHTNATGQLDAGALSVVAPAIERSPTRTLTGLTQTVPADVGAWTVSDATGGNDGYTITVGAGAPTVGGGTAGTGGSTLTLAEPTGEATADARNPATAGPLHATGHEAAHSARRHDRHRHINTRPGQVGLRGRRRRACPS